MIPDHNKQSDDHNPDKEDGQPVPDPFAFDLFETCLVAVCLVLMVVVLAYVGATRA